MDFVSKKWALLILLEIYKSNKEKVRYSYIKNNMEDIDEDTFSTIAATILGGALQVSPMGVGNFMQLALMYDDGVIMAACPKNKELFLIGALNKQASVNLIGIALKQSSEKLEKMSL